MRSQTNPPQNIPESNVSQGSKQESFNTVAGIVKCLYDSVEDKETIQCGNCSTWQHVNCFYYGLENLYSSLVIHLCENCDPRPKGERGNAFPEKIVKKGWRKGQRGTGQGKGHKYEQYLIKWIGLPDKNNSWVSANDVPTHMIELFEQNLAAAVQSKKRKIQTMSKANTTCLLAPAKALRSTELEDENGRDFHDDEGEARANGGVKTTSLEIPASPTAEIVPSTPANLLLPRAPPRHGNSLQQIFSSMMDQDKLYDYINILLGVDLIALRIDSAHFSYDDFEYRNEGFPLLFDHDCAVQEWQQFHWIYTNTGCTTEENTKETLRIGIKFVYATTDPLTGPFTGFAWLVIQPKNGHQSLSLERVVLALNVSISRDCWPDNQEIQELRDLTRLCRLLHQLSDGIQRKLSPLNGRYSTKDNILLSFVLPEFSFAKLKEGAEFDTLSPLDVLGRLKELKQIGIQAPEASRQRQTARSSQFRNYSAVQQATPEPESEPDPVRLVKVARLAPFPLELLGDQLRSLHSAQKANFPEEPIIDIRRKDSASLETWSPRPCKQTSRYGDFVALPQSYPSIDHHDPEICIYLNAHSLLPPNNLLDYQLRHDHTRKTIAYKFMRFHKYWPNGQQRAGARSGNRPLLTELLVRLKLDETFLERLQMFLRKMYDQFTKLNLVQRGEYDPATISWLEPQWDGNFHSTTPLLSRVTRSRISRHIASIRIDQPTQNVVFPTKDDRTQLRDRRVSQGYARQTLQSSSGFCAQLGIDMAAEEDRSIAGQDVKDSQGSLGQVLRMRELAKDRTLADENLFRFQLTALSNFHNVGNINFNPLICSRTVSLFQIWKVVRDLGSENIDWINGWGLVATRLGFNKEQEVAAAEELRTCYNQLLKDLEDIKDDSDEVPDWLNSSHL